MLPEVDQWIKMGLREDIGSGDVTTNITIELNQRGRAVIIACEELVLAGISLAEKVFLTLDESLRFSPFFQDGQRVLASQTLAEIEGNLRPILSGERLALNFLQRLSGIATLTRKFVEKVEGLGVKIVDTRKTTPGFRALEKYAVRMGGGGNHRMGLYDGILIKDNHIKACGGIAKAIERVKSKAPFVLKIEVEVSNLAEVKEALDLGVDIIMLDNMPIGEIERAVQLIKAKAWVEASGGVNLENVSEVARTGVDFISVGAITHSARSVDIKMEII